MRFQPYYVLLMLTMAIACGPEPENTSEGSGESGIRYCDAFSDCAQSPCEAAWCNPVRDEPNPDGHWGVCRSYPVAEGGPCNDGTGTCQSNICIDIPQEVPTVWTRSAAAFAFHAASYGPPTPEGYAVHLTAKRGDYLDITGIGAPAAGRDAPGILCELRLYTQVGTTPAGPIALGGYTQFVNLPNTAGVPVQIHGSHYATTDGPLDIMLFGRSSAAGEGCQFGGDASLSVMNLH